jgi:tRNA-dihydrouridine synthase B
MLQIGSYKLTSNVLLAPMAGITDQPFREICRKYNAGLAVSEMLTSDTQLWNSKKSAARLPQTGESKPRAIQIAGTNPQMMANAARICSQKGAQIIDINMGCPAKKVCNKAAGSALLQYPDLVQAILKAVKSSVDIPVTLKMRTGWSTKNKNALKIAEIAQRNNLAAITIHGRTRDDAYKGHAEYETIRQVKKAVDMPVIANGDINSFTKAQFVLDYTKADGLMLGRFAQGQPWIFQRIQHYLNTGHIPSDIEYETKVETILQHLRLIHEHYGPKTGVRMARKHINWYLSHLIPATQKDMFPHIRQPIFGATTPERQVLLVKQTLDIFSPLNPKKAA